MKSLLLWLPIFPVVYMCSISQRNDGWKCVWIYLICPRTLITFDCLKSSWCNLPSESHLFHFCFQGSCYSSFCLTNIITDTHISHSSSNFILKKPTWLTVIPKINFPCNFCHLGWSDFRLNWFLLKRWTNAGLTYGLLNCSQIPVGLTQGVELFNVGRLFDRDNA